MIPMINDFRASEGVWYWNEDNNTKTVFNTSGQTYLEPLRYDYDLEQIAMQRARELAVYYSHTRPNGTSCFTLTVNGTRSYGENIAMGHTNAEWVFDDWREDNYGYSGQGHRRNMLNQGFTAVGFGCFYFEGKLYWAQEFSYYYSGAPATSPNEGDVTGYVEYSSDIVDWTDVEDRPPEITDNPPDWTAFSDNTVEFTVSAKRATSYQWQYWSTSDQKWYNVTASDIIGAKTATMTVPATAARDDMKYRCAVSNANGTTYSEYGKLSVICQYMPSITRQPSSVTTTVGSKATFKVTAKDATTYQWQFWSNSGQIWKNVTASDITGTQKATMTVPATTARNGVKYRCLAINEIGPCYSNEVTLTVTSASKPTITTQPSNKTATAGSSANFSVTATGATSYQWQYWKSSTSSWTNVTASDISGAKSATMTVPATSARNGIKYRCKVTNSAGTTNSNSATLTVTSASKPTITTQPSSKTAEAGSSAKFSVTATGATSYQWQYRTSSTGTWVNITSTAYSGLKSATMTAPATTDRDGYQYRCAVSNAVGTVYSNSATLTILTQPRITRYCSNITTTCEMTVEFYVEASGGGLSYQWQYSSDGGNTWGNITNTNYEGVHTSVLSVPATFSRNGYQFRCKVSNAVGTIYSPAATLTVG